MQLVEQHVIDKEDARYPLIDAAAFASKNLYNAANYLVRQSFIHHGVYPSYPEVYHQMKSHEAYRALPTKVSQQVMKVLDKNWKGYFEACKAWQADPSKFLGHPKLPGYKEKQHGRKLMGIRVITTEESYTGKASFLDGDFLPTYGECRGVGEVEQEPVFSGRRVKRGLYRASGKRYLNADVNGSYNILRKVAPDAFMQGSRGCVVHPLPLRA